MLYFPSRPFQCVEWSFYGLLVAGVFVGMWIVDAGDVELDV